MLTPVSAYAGTLLIEMENLNRATHFARRYTPNETHSVTDSGTITLNYRLSTLNFLRDLPSGFPDHKVVERLLCLVDDEPNHGDVIDEA